MKKILAMIFAAALLSAAPAAWAEHMMGDKEGCPMGKGGGCSHGGCSMGDHDKGEGCPILGKVIKKAHYILEHQTELGLTDEQVQQVKKIKTEAKKSNIMAAAGMQVMMLDMEAKLSEQPFDAEGMKAMMDKNAQGWVDGAKASIDQYAALKKVLSEQQWAKLKELWTAKKTESGSAHSH